MTEQNGEKTTERQAEMTQLTAINRKKKKRKKRKTSRGLRDIQKFERRMSRASHRISRAVTDGITTYRKQSRQSARKKRDGAVKDFLPNSAKAFGRSLRRAAFVPYDLVKVFDIKPVQRQLRVMERMFWR